MSSSDNQAQNSANEAATTGGPTDTTPIPTFAPPAQTDTQAHLAAFFAQYQGFQYNSSQAAVNQFNRLRRSHEWGRNSTELTDARQDFRRALVLQFNATYGTNQNDLAAWQNLCRALNVEDIPEELSECKKLIKRLFINLVDLVDSPNTGRAVRHFETNAKLSKYTRRTGKFMSKGDAHAGGLLKYLLRQILFPHDPEPE
ncbi:hypothetical protein BDV93DRAFT_592384 [Ceratobasidium sp. AG-I]|nr:hypothetical protein BDV93DRAFT_592384 [Ceratobasidium sp. AG-I]